jgi:hypothetical protein
VQRVGVAKDDGCRARDAGFRCIAHALELSGWTTQEDIAVLRGEMLGLFNKLGDWFARFCRHVGARMIPQEAFLPPYCGSPYMLGCTHEFPGPFVPRGWR